MNDIENNITPQDIYKRTITLPRGTLDLTYQTNAATAKNDPEKNGSYQLPVATERRN